MLYKSGRVRKVYDGLKKEELEELANDIPKLLNEKEGGSFVNSLFNQ
jgi:protein SCO1/2